MKKQPEVTENTKRKILDAFWKLFKNQPIEKITIFSLSNEACIHRSSFYRYFADIYQVLEVFQEDLLFDIKKKIDSIQDNTYVTLPKYAEKISNLLIHFSDKIYRLLNYKESDFREKFIKTITPNVEKYLPLEQYNQHSEYITSFIISTIIFNFTFWYENRERYELQNLIGLGQSIILNGIEIIQK